MPASLPAARLRLSELLGALSHALDITEGQPAGHSARCCWIGMHIGRELGLPEPELWELYYALLLKDLGCSSNAARLCQLYGADDLRFKRDFKRVDRTMPALAGFLLGHAGDQAPMSTRLRSILTSMREGGAFEQELIETRCHRGADIARQLRFSEQVAFAVQNLDEHWNGGGKPTGAAGEAIPLFARIMLLSQVAEVFHAGGGPDAARAVVRLRAGRWFDPALARAFEAAAARPDFWAELAAADLEQQLLTLEPAQHAVALDDDYLDDIADAFGAIIDAKSPYTAGHSERVSLFTDQIAAALGVAADRRRWLRRGALLHDLGKLGVSNAILDKPGKLDEAEWVVMRGHAGQTQAILSRIAAFDELACISAAHHERLDGKGYPLGLRDAQISLETRIITTADIYDALSAERPYRGALPPEIALGIMQGMVGEALDARVFEALEGVVTSGAERLAA